MLRLERRFALDGQAYRHAVSWMSPELRTYLVDTAGVVFDTDVHRPGFLAVPHRAGQLVIVLDGEYLLRHAGRSWTLRAGDALLAPMVGWNERWEGDRVRMLVVEWGARHGGEVSWPTELRFDRVQRAVLETIALALATGTPAARAMPALLELAIALGAPLVPWHDQRPLACPAPVRRVHDALTAALSNPATPPMWVDLEAALGVSARTMRRWIEHDRAWFGWLPDFRSQIRYWKLSSASMLLTAPASRIDHVAHVTGYGSPRALHKALEDDGLMAPTAMRRALGLRPG